MKKENILVAVLLTIAVFGIGGSSLDDCCVWDWLLHQYWFSRGSISI